MSFKLENGTDEQLQKTNLVDAYYLGAEMYFKSRVSTGHQKTLLENQSRFLMSTCRTLEQELSQR